MSTGVKDLGALPSVTGSGNISGAHAYVKVTAPVANGGTIAVGDQITVDYMVYKAAPGGLDNGGPDPDIWTLNAPTNAAINGNVVVDENGLNGETHSSAYICSGNTGLESLTGANPQSGASSYTIQYDGRSADACFAFKDDGVLIHTQFVATVTAPGLVTVKGFAGLSGTDPTVPAGPFSTGAITDAQVGIAYTAVDATPPTVNITSPVDGSVLGHNAAVNAAFTCSDNVGVSSCTGQMVGGATVANGSPIDTSTGGPHQFKVTAVDAAGNTAVSYVTYNVAPPTVDLSGCTVNEGATCVFTGHDVLRQHHPGVGAGRHLRRHGRGAGSLHGTVGGPHDPRWSDLGDAVGGHQVRRGPAGRPDLHRHHVEPRGPVPGHRGRDGHDP